MFRPGQIVYFRPFYFKNGNTSKNKYFIVLRVIDGSIVIASLPTSISKAPSLVTTAHGCINIDDKCFNCYLFEQGRVIGDQNFSFPLPTYVYGNEVGDYEVEVLNSVYPIENVDFEIVCNLLPSEFTNLVDCISQSASIKRKIKRWLSK